MTSDDVRAVDDLLDAAHACGWKAQWGTLAPPTSGYRATLIRPTGPPISAFGQSLAEACDALRRRLRT